jgi:nitrite reductase (NO-forming)
MTSTDRSLPLVQAPVEGACCDACATAAVAPVPPAVAAPVPRAPTLPLQAERRRPISRTHDRRITFAGLTVAAGLMGLAVASLALPEAARRGTWLALHLALAGAAGTAIASVLPFFTAALAIASPADPRARIVAIGGIAGGAVAVSAGVAAGLTMLAVGGGLAYLVGLAALSVAAFVPLRDALGPRRPLVTRAYAVAIACVMVGVALSTAMLAGAGPVLERWALLKPAHAWLNVIGFLSVIVAASLVHLAPTVAGARMRPRTSARIAIAGLAVGAPSLAIGLVLASDLFVRLGAVVTVGGALALVAHGIVIHRERGRWTTDPAWHRLTSWSLLLAPVWLVAGVGIAGGRFLAFGADPRAWDIGAVAPALALGWVAQVLIGSWSHLLPAIGPGDPIAHARQRGILGRGATIRIVALNVGVVSASIGVLMTSTPAVALGVGLALGSVVGGLATFARAGWIGAGPIARN